MILRQLNNLTENAPKTYLSDMEVSGTTVLRWKNPAGFGASWAVQLGETGEEQSEVVNLTSDAPTGTIGTISVATKYAHSADTPVYAIKYDQVVFEKSTAGTAGTAAPIASGTITIQADSKFTSFDDTAGTTTDAWKTYFRSSGLTVNTTESDWITSSGYSFYSLAKMRERVKEKLWNPNYLVDTTINNWINEWMEKMRNAVISVNEDYAMGTANITFGTNGFGTITQGDFKSLRRIDVTYNGSDYHMATKMMYNSYLPDQVFNTTSPQFFMFGENVIGIKPEDAGGTAKIGYYALLSPLENDSDELPTSMRGYTLSFTNYCLSQALYKENKTDQAASVYSSAAADLERFKSELSPRNKTGPTYIKQVEPISAEEGW
jgi:hypothetical protein